MISTITSLIPLSFRLGTVIVLIILGVIAYDTFIDDPEVARKAREDYVHITEKLALQAQIALKDRALQRAREAADAYAEIVAELRREIEEEEQRIQEEIKAYEIKLADAGRSCHLDHADIDWLSKP